MTAGWQPIETAPKDGTGVLAHAVGADGRPMIVIVRWACAAHAFHPYRRCGSHDASTPECDFQWLGTMASRFGVEFTHWIPLPDPPT